MIDKKLSLVAMLGLAATLSMSAMAQDGSAASAASPSASVSSSAMTTEAVPFSGTVLAYNYGLNGYRTAVQVQTSDGVRVLRFAPDMAQRLSANFPVGASITGSMQSVMAAGAMGAMESNLVALGEATPATGMVQADVSRDNVLRMAAPTAGGGGRGVNLQGRLQGVVVNKQNEIVALVLHDNRMSDAGLDMVLVRVPPQFLNFMTSTTNMARGPQLARGDIINVAGSEEPSTQGSTSVYRMRVAASVLVVNGRTVQGLSKPSLQGKTIMAGPVRLIRLNQNEVATYEAQAK